MWATSVEFTADIHSTLEMLAVSHAIQFFLEFLNWTPE
jgi:hypothetical protein